MDDSNQLVLCARLKESMLYVGEKNVYLETFCGAISQTVLMHLEITNCLSALKVWLDDYVLKRVSSSRDGVEGLLSSRTMLLLDVLLLLLDLSLFDQVFDLFLGNTKMVILSFPVLVFER
jgi:hypothetical protein